MDNPFPWFVGVAHVGGYYMYYLASKKDVVPNTTSWAIWAFGSILNVWSYRDLTGEWNAKTVLPVVCSICCISLFVSCLMRGRFKKMTKLDVIVFSADVVAMIVWAENDALVGNIAVQISTLISFFPMIRDVWDDPQNEDPNPWIVWTVAYFLDIMLCCTQWNGWGEVIYPINCMVLHASVAILATRRQR